MNAIKEYKELTTLELFDGKIYTTMSLDQLQEVLDSDWKFMKIWNQIIAKHQIKKACITDVSDIDNFILSQSDRVQEQLMQREKRKKDNLWKWFDSVWEIQRYMEKKWL